MKLKKIMIDEIVLPKYNPRHITPEALESLKKSIKEFDYIDPIIVNDVNMHVVGGNQRVVALQELGYTEIDAVFIHEPDLNREKAINIRLNNSSGDWDIGKLDTIFNDLEIEGFDLTLTGFATENLQPFETNDDDTDIPTSEIITSDLNTGLKPLPTEQPGATPIEIEEDDFEEPDSNEIKVHVAKGDLWKLGNHYLFCGDATNKDDVELLLNAEREREP